MEDNKKEKNEISISQIWKLISSKKKNFLIIWILTFALACLWILPQPRYYTCEVSLAPEGTSDEMGGLASVASSFGFDIGSGTTIDAIYPTLYPDLFESNDFISSLLKIKVKTDDGSVSTDYYTYLLKHQKKNWLTRPFTNLIGKITEYFGEKSTVQEGKAVDPFYLTRKESSIFEKVKKNVKCSIDKKTSVITISVEDQDKLICATLADSIKEHLQAFIIDYRTGKTAKDVAHYKHLTDSTRLEYEAALRNYASYEDGHRNLVLDAYKEEGERLNNEVQLKLSTYNTLNTQYQAMKAKLQERTPSFTTLKSATVPIKPAGPKRMVFVILMMFLTTFLSCAWFTRAILPQYIKQLLW